MGCDERKISFYFVWKVNEERKIKNFAIGLKKYLIFLKKCAILHKQNLIRPYRLAVRTAPSHGANSGSSPDKVTTMPPQRVAFFVCGLIGKDEEYEGFGKIQASIGACFSLSEAKAPDKVTSNNLNRTPQLEGGRFGLFHFLKYILRRFPLPWEHFSFFDT